MFLLPIQTYVQHKHKQHQSIHILYQLYILLLEPLRILYEQTPQASWLGCSNEHIIVEKEIEMDGFLT